MAEQQDIIHQIKNLYQNYQLQSCIQKVDEVNNNVSFDSYQVIQLFKALSYFELSQIKEGKQCIDNLIRDSSKEKGDKIDQIDLVIRIIYTIQIYYYDQYESEQMHDKLLNLSKQWKLQNKHSDQYQKSLYLFAKGVYNFIEKINDEKNIECIKYLEQANHIKDLFQIDLILFLGWVYFSKGMINKAEEITQKLYEINPCFPGVTNNLAIYNRNLKQYELTLKFYEEADKLSPFNSGILDNISYYYQVIGNKEKALEYSERGYNSLPRSAKSCYKYGKLLYKEKKIEEGIKKFKEGIIIDPKYAYNYIELANCIAKKEPLGALELLMTVKELQPNCGNSYLQIGDFYFRLFDFDQAIYWYQQSLLFKNKKFIEYKVYSMLARSFIEISEFDKSIEYFFIASNYENNGYDTNNINYLCQIINEGDLIQDKLLIQLANKYQGHIISKYNNFIRQIQDANIKSLFSEKLDILRSVLEMIAQQKNVQQYLTFQSNLSHLDLYYD